QACLVPAQSSPRRITRRRRRGQLCQVASCVNAPFLPPNSGPLSAASAVRFEPIFNCHYALSNIVGCKSRLSLFISTITISENAVLRAEGLPDLVMKDLREEQFRALGFWIVEKFLRCPLLDNLAFIHENDTISY